MDWFRWHHGTVSDPKWRVVAIEAGVPVASVVAVWAAMLEHASENDPRGTIEGWEDRVIGAALDLKAETVAAIRQAMQGLTLDDDQLPSWSKRQPKREDRSVDRVRAHRERKKERVKRDVTHRNAPEKRREEEIREDTETTPPLRLHVRDDRESQADEIIRAANRGMSANSAIAETFHPILPGHGSRQHVIDWLADGIPAELAAAIVEDRAIAWTDDSGRRQISSMAYFDGAVRDEWARRQAKAGGNGRKLAPDHQDYGEGTTEYRGLNG